VAGSQYTPNNGWVPQQAVNAQMSLLRWFDHHIGRPRHTVAQGADMGGVVSIMLAERDPADFNGAVSLGAQTAGSVINWNLGLDLSFAFKMLLAPHSHLQLVNISNPSANLALAQKLITAAQATPQGPLRARPFSVPESHPRRLRASGPDVAAVARTLGHAGVRSYCPPSARSPVASARSAHPDAAS
jgi:pimeloyl-ACP methyl ester carboxylesterase